MVRYGCSVRAREARHRFLRAVGHVYPVAPAARSGSARPGSGGFPAYLSDD